MPIQCAMYVTHTGIKGLRQRERILNLNQLHFPEILIMFIDLPQIIYNHI